LKQCEKQKIFITKLNTHEDLDQEVNRLIEESGKAPFKLFEDLETQILEKEKFIESQVELVKQIYEDYIDLVEQKQVLNRSFELVSGLKKQLNESSQVEGVKNSGYAHSALEEEDEQESNFFQEVKIETICGTVESKEAERFKRLIYRQTRGQVLMHFSDLNMNVKNFEGEVIRKQVYVLMFHDMEILRLKIGRICDSFQSKRFMTPGTNKRAFKDKITETQVRIGETNQMLRRTRLQLKNYLQ